MDMQIAMLECGGAGEGSSAELMQILGRSRLTSCASTRTVEPHHVSLCGDLTRGDRPAPAGKERDPQRARHGHRANGELRFAGSVRLPCRTTVCLSTARRPPCRFLFATTRDRSFAATPSCCSRCRFRSWSSAPRSPRTSRCISTMTMRAQRACDARAAHR
jgi:hypothetical protein